MLIPVVGSIRTTAKLLAKINSTNFSHLDFSLSHFHAYVAACFAVFSVCRVIYSWLACVVSTRAKMNEKKFLLIHVNFNATVLTEYYDEAARQQHWQ